MWLDDALHFCTGPEEQKARNLERNPHVVLTTGSNAYGEGLDVVVDGDAVRVTDNDRLHRIADAYESKYGAEWHFDVRRRCVRTRARARPCVFAISPTAVFAYARGAIYSQTRCDV